MKSENVLSELPTQSKESKRKTPIAIITIPARPATKQVMFVEPTSSFEKEQENSKNTSSSTSFEVPAKRSKSEASKQEDQGTIINRARKNLFRVRKLSPNKLDA
jgi:hypothetical protein